MFFHLNEILVIRCARFFSRLKAKSHQTLMTAEHFHLVPQWVGRSAGSGWTRARPPNLICRHAPNLQRFHGNASTCSWLVVLCPTRVWPGFKCATLGELQSLGALQRLKKDTSCLCSSLIFIIMVEQFAGNWTLATSENFDDYMKAIGKLFF